MAVAVVLGTVLAGAVAWSLHGGPGRSFHAEAGTTAPSFGMSSAGAVAAVARTGAPRATPATAQGLSPAGQAASASGGTGLGAVVVRRVEENAAVVLDVKDVQGSFTAIGTLVQGLGGYVQSSSLSTGIGQGPLPWLGGLPASTASRASVSATTPFAAPSATLVLAVPQSQLQTCLEQVEALRKVVQPSASGQDVTQQYIDLTARISALQAERQSYLTLLGRATSIADILQIQSALTGVQSQLEDLQGQLKTIDTLTANAYLTVTLQVAPLPLQSGRAPSALARLSMALRRSVRALLTGATDLGLTAAWLLPWAAVAALGYGVYRGIAARRRVQG